MNRRRPWLAVVIAVAPLARAEDTRDVPIGMPGRIDELVLPGGELEPKETDFKSPIALRVASVAPHGDRLRYSLVYWGLEAGTFDLRTFLARRDGSATDDLPAIPVTIRSVLPDGQILPNRLDSGEIPALGGYRTWIALGAVTWIVGFLTILLVRRTKRRREVEEAARPVTMAERLRPLVERASSGRGTPEDHAELEMLLVAYWRRRLGLDDVRPSDALARLKEHAEAGPLLRRVEEWLHHPSPTAAADLRELLRPYAAAPARTEA